jgi:hypothetical protein
MTEKSPYITGKEQQTSIFKQYKIRIGKALNNVNNFDNVAEHFLYICFLGLLASVTDGS